MPPHLSLRRLVRHSGHPVVMFRPGDGEILEVSDALVAMFGASHQQMVGRPVLDFVIDEAAARARWALMAAGELDGYHLIDRAYRRIDGSEFSVDTCVNSMGEGSADHSAVAVLVPMRRASPQTAVPADPVNAVVLGTVDADWNIDRVGSDVRQLLGYLPDELIGQPIVALIEATDLSRWLVGVAGALHDPGGATVGVGLKTVTGECRQCQMLVTRLGSDPDPGLAFGFAISEPKAGHVVDRTWELERVLQRIAREIEASGVLTAPWGPGSSPRLPLLRGLSTRELEIVTRLVMGDRVPMIARRLFLSQSTVRNHLTSVYRKLGVHSQQQLLSLIRTDRTFPKSGDFV